MMFISVNTFILRSSGYTVESCSFASAQNLSLSEYFKIFDKFSVIKSLNTLLNTCGLIGLLSKKIRKIGERVLKVTGHKLETQLLPFLV